MCTETAETVAQADVGDGQGYYWTDEWQRDEQVAVAELDRGEGRRFETADDAIRWLNDSDRG